MTKDEALDLAQKALEDACGNRCNAEYNPCFQREAINAIKAVRETKDEPAAWAPYLSDRADGVQGHYAIARWNPRGYREVWNLRRHTWGAFSDDVMSLEEADYLLQQITIPTRKPTPPAQLVIDESAAKRIATALGWEPKRKPLTDEQVWACLPKDPDEMAFARAIEAAQGITGDNK